MNICKRVAAPSVVAIAALGLCACADDDETPVAPLGPPDLEITSIVAGAGQRWSRGDPMTLTVSCEAFAPIAVDVETDPDPLDGVQPWVFRPPGFCGSRVQCGYVALEVQPPSGVPLTAQAAGSSITMSLQRPGSDAGSLSSDAGDAAFAAPEASELVAGEYRFFVELRTGNGQPFTRSGAGFSDEVTLRLELSAGCAASDGGTSDAAADSPPIPDDGSDANTPADAQSDRASDADQG